MAEVGPVARIDAEHQLRRPPQNGEGAAVDAALAQQDRVLEAARGHVGLTLQQGVLGQAAAGVVLQLHAQPLGGEVVQLLGQGQRQVGQRPAPADGDAEARLLRPHPGLRHAGPAPRHAQRGHGRSLQPLAA